MKVRTAAFALLLAALPLAALDYPPLTPNPAAYKARRDKFMSQLPPKSIAILRSAPMRTMSNDVEYLYRPDSDFFYLTGIEQENVTIVLRPDAADGKKYIAFVPPRDPRRESWEGIRVGPNEAVAAWGVDAVYDLKDFDSKMSEFDRNTYRSSGYLADAEALYLLDGDDAEWLEKFRESFDPLGARLPFRVFEQFRAVPQASAFRSDDQRTKQRDVAEDFETDQAGRLRGRSGEIEMLDVRCGEVLGRQSGVLEKPDRRR